MDAMTLAAELLGGVGAAMLAGVMPGTCRLGVLGALIVGLVGGALGGLILMQYTGPTAPGMASDATALAIHAASGAAGGTALAIVTGLLLRSCVRAR